MHLVVRTSLILIFEVFQVAAAHACAGAYASGGASDGGGASAAAGGGGGGGGTAASTTWATRAIVGAPLHWTAHRMFTFPKQKLTPDTMV